MHGCPLELFCTSGHLVVAHSPFLVFLKFPNLISDKMLAIFIVYSFLISYFVDYFSYILSCRVHLRWRILAILALGLGISLVHLLSILGLFG